MASNSSCTQHVLLVCIKSTAGHGCLQGVNHVKHMAAGALAACVSRTLVAPFERVKMECILRQRELAVQPCGKFGKLAHCQMTRRRLGKRLHAI